MIVLAAPFSRRKLLKETDTVQLLTNKTLCFPYSIHITFVFVNMDTLTFALAFTSGCCVDDSNIFTTS